MIAASSSTRALRESGSSKSKPTESASRPFSCTGGRSGRGAGFHVFGGRRSRTTGVVVSSTHSSSSLSSAAAKAAAAASFAFFASADFAAAPLAPPFGPAIFFFFQAQTRSRAPAVLLPAEARRRLRPGIGHAGRERESGGKGRARRGRVFDRFGSAGFEEKRPGWRRETQTAVRREERLLASGVFDGGTRRVCRARRASRFEKRSNRFARGARPGAFGRGVRSRTRRAGRSRRAPTREDRGAPRALAPRSRVGAEEGAGDRPLETPAPPSPRRRSRLAPRGTHRQCRGSCVGTDVGGARPATPASHGNPGPRPR